MDTLRLKTSHLNVIPMRNLIKKQFKLIFIEQTESVRVCMLLVVENCVFALAVCTG